MNSEIESKVQSFFNIVSNNKKNKALDKTNLIIVADNRDRAINFAHDIAQVLSVMKVCTSFKEFSSKEVHETQDDLLIVDDFNSNIRWDEIKNSLDGINQIVIFCTDKNSQNRYLESINDYYAIFSTQIILDPLNIEEIKSGAHFYFKKLESSKDIYLDKTFFPALYDYIDTVYPRANLKGEEFVYDLKDRFLRESYATDHPRKFTAATIPYYFKKESIESIKKAIREDFCYSTCIDKILKDVDNAHKAKSLKLLSYKPTFNMNLVSGSDSTLEQFVRQYGALLNSNEISVISAKDVISMNPYDFMRNKDDIQNMHGVILLEQFARLTDIDNVDDVIQYLIETVDNEKNDIVWILSGSTDFYSYVNETNRTKMEFLFRNQYSLDEHDETSSVNYIKSIYSKNGLAISDENLEILKPQVISSKNVNEANTIVEQFLAEHIADTASAPSQNKKKKTGTFLDVIEKEKTIRSLVNKIPDSKNEENVLLLAMSTLSNRMSINEYHYQESDDLISGYYVSQLEPVPKVMAEKLARKNKKLNKIIVLNTKDTLNPLTVNQEFKDNDQEYSAYTYFKERCNCIIPDSGFFNINLQTNFGENQFEKAIYFFTNALKDITAEGKKVNLYVDIHGGIRDAAIVVDSLLMLIKEIPDIELKDIYQVNFTYGKPTVMYSINNDFKVFDFVSGMNEFLSFGRSNNLVKFNQNRNNSENQKLVDVINTISDNIILDRMAQFSENLHSLSTIVNKEDSEYGYFDTVKSLIRSNYEVEISGTKYNLLREGNSYFPAELQWCVNKKLIQQALVLIESNTAKFLKSQKILDTQAKKIEEVLGDWAKYALCKLEYRSNNVIGIDSNNVRDWENDYYYKEYKDPFNDIQISDLCGNSTVESSYKRILCEIDNLRNKGNHDYKKYNHVNKHANNYISVKFYSESIKFDINEKKVPINSDFVENKEFMKLFYQFLYVYKGLKKSRNEVAHPKEKKHELSSNEVELWIRLYILLFDHLVKLSKEIIASKNKLVTNNIKEAKVDTEKDENKPKVTSPASEDVLKKFAEKVNNERGH